VTPTLNDFETWFFYFA
jgi:hypothetical protein